MTDRPTLTRAQLEQLVVDANRRQALADALAAPEHIPTGLEPVAILGRLLERLGLPELLYRIYLAQWPPEDIGVLLRGIGVDEIDVEQAMVRIDADPSLIAWQPEG